MHCLPFIVLYGLLPALGHLGPGATVGLTSWEESPTPVCGMGCGIAAAFGKAEAAVGTQVFTPIREAAGPASTFHVAGAIGIVASGSHYFLPKGNRLELERADEEFERLNQSEASN